MNSDKQHKMQRVIKLLKFVMTVDDKEVIEAVIESVIETLEEIEGITKHSCDE